MGLEGVSIWGLCAYYTATCSLWLQQLELWDQDSGLGGKAGRKFLVAAIPSYAPPTTHIDCFDRKEVSSHRLFCFGVRPRICSESPEVRPILHNRGFAARVSNDAAGLVCENRC